MIRFIQVILMTTASKKRNKISLRCRIFLEIYDPLGEKPGELKRDITNYATRFSVSFYNFKNLQKI